MASTARVSFRVADGVIYVVIRFPWGHSAIVHLLNHVVNLVDESNDDAVQIMLGMDDMRCHQMVLNMWEITATMAARPLEGVRSPKVTVKLMTEERMVAQ